MIENDIEVIGVTFNENCKIKNPDMDF
jgi:hypothetical protein